MQNPDTIEEITLHPVPVVSKAELDRRAAARARRLFHVFHKTGVWLPFHTPVFRTQRLCWVSSAPKTSLLGKH